jgi:hypothetical protein
LSPPRIHKLKKKKLFVGSDSSCHICVPDEGCAKRQALIYSGITTFRARAAIAPAAAGANLLSLSLRADNGVIMIRDLDASKGSTKVNGQAVPEKGTVLRPGDVLAIGKTKIVVCNDRYTVLSLCTHQTAGMIN